MSNEQAPRMTADDTLPTINIKSLSVRSLTGLTKELSDGKREATPEFVQALIDRAHELRAEIEAEVRTRTFDDPMRQPARHALTYLVRAITTLQRLSYGLRQGKPRIDVNEERQRLALQLKHERLMQREELNADVAWWAATHLATSEDDVSAMLRAALRSGLREDVVRLFERTTGADTEALR